MLNMSNKSKGIADNLWKQIHAESPTLLVLRNQIAHSGWPNADNVMHLYNTLMHGRLPSFRQKPDSIGQLYSRVRDWILDQDAVQAAKICGDFNLAIARRVTGLCLRYMYINRATTHGPHEAAELGHNALSGTRVDKIIFDDVEQPKQAWEKLEPHTHIHLSVEAHSALAAYGDDQADANRYITGIVDALGTCPRTKTFTLLPPEPTVNIKIETKTFFNGADISTMTDDALFDNIQRAENEIQRLENIKTKPKRLTKKIEELQAGLKQLVEVLDSRD